MTTIIQTNTAKLQKIIKYILIGLIVVFATNYIPDNKLKNKEIMMIGAISSIGFAILDMISPAITIHSYNQQNKETCEKILVEKFN
jgi:hypothetical protein